MIFTMDERIARELIAVRRAVKKKYQSLRSDMTQADLELEKQWKPLKELVNVVKREPMMETRITPRRGSTMMFEKDIRKKLHPHRSSICNPKQSLRRQLHPHRSSI